MTSTQKRQFFLWALLLAVTISYMLPFVWVALGSFKTRAEMFAVPPIIFPAKLNLANYATVLEAAPFLWNSILASVISTLLVLLLAIPAAYGFARFQLRRSRNIEFWILSTRMMPPIAVIVPIFVIFQKIALIDTIPGLVFLYTSFNLPFAIWMLTAFFKKVPYEIEEAARVDGAGLFLLVTRIVLPLVRPALAVVVIFSVIWAWNDLIFALILTSTNAKTLPVALSEFVNITNIRWELMAAMAVVQSLPVILLTFLSQRHIVTGLSLGGVEK